jgi:hypothetical protein
MDRSGEDHVKVVEMDVAGGRSSCSAAVPGDSRDDNRLAAEYYHHYQYQYPQCSPAPSSAALADLSPRTYSGHLDQDLLLLPYEPTDAAAGLDVPSYMANTESSRAKARSQSAPRQRATDDGHALERQPSRRRGRKTMQRSSSHIQYQYPPWAGVRLDRSSASLVGSECGSTTDAAGYCRSLVGFEVRNSQLIQMHTGIDPS